MRLHNGGPVGSGQVSPNERSTAGFCALVLLVVLCQTSRKLLPRRESGPTVLSPSKALVKVEFKFTQVIKKSIAVWCRRCSSSFKARDSDGASAFQHVTEDIRCVAAVQIFAGVQLHSNTNLTSLSKSSITRWRRLCLEASIAEVLLAGSPRSKSMHCFASVLSISLLIPVAGSIDDPASLDAPSLPDLAGRWQSLHQIWLITYSEREQDVQAEVCVKSANRTRCYAFLHTLTDIYS